MRIDQFTSDFSDNLCDLLGIEFVTEVLTEARSKDDIVLPVPGYRQTKSYTCGFVSGLMVARTFDPKVPHEKFYELCELHPEWGMSTKKLARALRQSGVGVRIRQGLHFDEIADYISAGQPIITSIKRHKDIQHWVVIYGVNKKLREVFIAGEKFWFSPAETVYKWNELRHKIPVQNDFLVCFRKSL
jgi:ABC-type bacteriocin/lantibiotic exporter with double-glycine peptidase domain